MYASRVQGWLKNPRREGHVGNFINHKDGIRELLRHADAASQIFASIALDSASL